MSFISNPQLDLAFDYVRSTDKNIYLTGKAGTGKTTFLHKIKQEALKRMVVTAPTGVAAINAGGMTLHSFFQLPFGLHLPGMARDSFRFHRFSREKLQIIRGLELLVIDEISMVRADLLDAVDDVLRRQRNNSAPFGGVQLLLIGDLHQLPPVVKPEEWELLRVHYPTAYFFSSIALQKSDLVSIELKHIYRQSDRRFIDLLNRVRDNAVDHDVLQALNTRYIPDFTPAESQPYITLTSHNAQADSINAQRLDALDGRIVAFKAQIKGDFPESAYPTEETLQFKIGAQVMFARNDASEEKRFFNGKIGAVTRFASGKIFVRCENESEEITVEPVEWQNLKYVLDEQTREIKADVLGAFTQYPLKLAWAITIHKSQGLTFDRAIIDARAAFAHGQVYVALSRCRTFEGIVLSSAISPSSVKTDGVVKNYSDEAGRNAPDAAHLERSRREHQEATLRDLFDFRAMRRHLQRLTYLFRGHDRALSEEGKSIFKALVETAEKDVLSIADKFEPHLQAYFSQAEPPDQNESLRERLKKAAVYFNSKLRPVVLPALESIHLVTDDKAVLKNARTLLGELRREILAKSACFSVCEAGFSTTLCVKARTNAHMESSESEQKTPRKAGSRDSVPKSHPHPELYARLMRWRSETAAKNGMAPREVLRTTSLDEVARRLPADIPALKGIMGIGNLRFKLFGPKLAEIISEYCSEKNISAEARVKANEMKVSKDSTGPKDPPPPPAAGNTKLISYDLYKSGKKIPEIASERDLSPATIEGHLAYFIGRRDLDISEFLAREQVEEISQFFRENGADATSPAKIRFGDKYSYGQLKMVQEYVKGL